MVVLGSPDPDSAALSAQTVVSGDPTYAGPLAEVQLGLAVYHILEDEVREAVPEQGWEEQVGVMAEVLDALTLAEPDRDSRRARAADGGSGGAAHRARRTSCAACLAG